MRRMGVKFAVLGPVEVSVDGETLDLGPARQRCVLVALLVDAGRPVTVERLATRVWGERPPRSVPESLRSYLSRLRQTFSGVPAVALTRQPAGYLLATGDAGVDLRDFGRLVKEAATAGDDEDARRLYDEALGLWRGEPFEGLDSPWLTEVRESLWQQRFAAELDFADVCLRLGRHADVVATLTQRAREYPLDERLAGQLMLALHRSGRTAEALAHFDDLRKALSTELGVDPGPALARVHLDLLKSDAIVDTAMPRQLPAAPVLFSGRAGELAALDHDAPVRVVHGPGGVGKTWLALRWAHDNAPSFPDGQLYVNLRGFGPAGTAVDAGAAVRGFLGALGVPPERVPHEPNAQVGLYRSTLHGKRVLVVLDNARDAEHVRPLLPGHGGCVVVVTSRDRLAGLVAAEGARALELALLTADQARDLLVRRLGADLVVAEPRAAEQVIARCAGLPLALAVAAARVPRHVPLPLARLARELGEPHGLDPFGSGDTSTDVRAVFSWSYQALSPAAAHLFRLLGLHPGPDVTPAAASALAGLPVHRVSRSLAELVRAHLIGEHTPGRYAFHDLLRMYAIEQSGLEPDGDAAVRRLLDHLLHTAHTAVLLLEPERTAFDLDPPEPGAAVLRPAGHPEALAWFTAEYPVLLAAVRLAVTAGLDRRAWQLAWAMNTFMIRHGVWHELVDLQQTALGATRRLGDLAGEGFIRRCLARAYTLAGRIDDAEDQYHQGLAVYRELGEPVGQGHAHIGLIDVAARRGELATALHHGEQAYEAYLAGGDRPAQANALNSIGWFHTQLGEHEQGLIYCERALVLLQSLGARFLEASALDSLGYIHRHLGNHDEAILAYRRCVEIFYDLGDRYDAADSLASMGDTYAAADDFDGARGAWQEALDVFTELGHPDAQSVRERLK